MTLSDFMPNWSIVRAPSNWFLVAFAMIILFLTLHIAFRDANFSGDTN